MKFNFGISKEFQVDNLIIKDSSLWCKSYLNEVRDVWKSYFRLGELSLSCLFLRGDCWSGSVSLTGSFLTSNAFFQPPVVNLVFKRESSTIPATCGSSSCVVIRAKASASSSEGSFLTFFDDFTCSNGKSFWSMILNLKVRVDDEQF